MALVDRDIFINCPFDDGYRNFFNAIVFTIMRSGFIARCALEADNAAVNRFDKIAAIVEECPLGVHDISRNEVDGDPPLPRFNMPLELGLFLGAKRFGGARQKRKSCIIFDRERFRFQQYISDIAGRDIHSHGGDVELLIVELAKWLRAHGQDPLVPGGAAIARDYGEFESTLPEILIAKGLSIAETTFHDYTTIVTKYLAQLAA